MNAFDQIDSRLAIAALERFLEADARRRQVRRKARATRPLEKKMARQVARWFVDQGEQVIKALARLSDRFDQNARLLNPVQESISMSDWVYLVSRIFRQTAPELEEIIDVFAGTALMAAANGLLGDEPLVGVSFSLRNPRAVAYAQGRAARQVTRINNTTRDRLNTVITNAVSEGKSWTRTAREIEDTFADFAGPPLFPSKKFFSRAEAVAAYEIGDAYEAGNEIAAGELVSAGLPMEKAWLSARDSKVRPTHSANDNQGWIPLDAEFESGDTRPPTDPGCRCGLQWRRVRAQTP